MNEETLFHEALARPDGPEREQFLIAACADRPELRAAVEALLAAHAESGDLLGRSPDDTSRNRDATTDQEPLLAEVVAEPALPSRIGRYHVRRLLGRGGMGVVYLAHDPELDRPVALKVPKLASPGAEERFLREARAAAAVTHPNLCPVFDVGRADGELYLAMAFIPGPTLTALLRQEGPLPPARAAALAAGIAAGMAEAHRHGIIHRDLKPGNVLLNRHGEPVVTDFGLARRGPGADSTGDPDETGFFDPRLTRDGAVMGTPAYMSPEQAKGQVDQVGPASDIYALGAILFELLTGRQPFHADSAAALVGKIEREPAPPPSQVRPGLPVKLDAICLKALAKKPAERVASMEAFAAALAPFASGVKRRRLRWVTISAAAVLLPVLAGIIFYLKTDHGDVIVRFNDPNAKVEITVDGNEITIDENGRITRLTTGPHTMQVKGPDFETQTKLFKITRQETSLVEFELRPKANSATAASPPGRAGRARLATLLANGHELFLRDAFKAVGQVADEALRIDPESPGALALRSVYRGTCGDRAGSRKDADAALRLNSETFLALYVRGFLEEEKHDESIADLTIALRLNPTISSTWANRANAYLRKGEYRQAIADATRSIEMHFQGYRPYVARAIARGQLGDFQGALADLNKAAGFDRGYATINVLRAGVYAKMGDFKKSDAEWAEAKTRDAALTDESRAVFHDPPKPLPPKKLSPAEQTALEAALGLADKAAANDAAVGDGLKAADEACRLDPTSAKAHSLRARLYGMTGRFKEGLVEANEAIRLNTDDVWAYVMRGSCKDETGDHAGAIADHTIAIRLDPKHPLAWRNRGSSYFRRGHYSQSLADTNESLRLRSGDTEALRNRAICYVNLGEYEKALADFERVAVVRDREAHAHRQLVPLYAKLGRSSDADRERKLAVKLNEKLKDAPDLELPAPAPKPKIDPQPGEDKP
jgi:serine/threonine protein kinase/tetratricopeptide (TPR) repeat protein